MGGPKTQVCSLVIGGFEDVRECTISLIPHLIPRFELGSLSLAGGLDDTCLGWVRRFTTPTEIFEQVATPATAPTSAPTLAASTDAISKSLEKSTFVALATTDVPATQAVPNNGTSSKPTLQAYPVPPGSRPHDVEPAPDGGAWYTAQGSGALGWLDPRTGETRHTPMGAGSRPHGVIVGPDGAPWVTDGGLNTIVRVDPENLVVDVFPLPLERPNANLNTATFNHDGVLWFTGQNGVYGRLDPSTREMEVFDAPHGRGPYGIVASPDGNVYYSSLAGSYVGSIDPESGHATVLDPPTANQGLDGYGRTPRDGCGSASGTLDRWRFTTAAPVNDANGSFQARDHRPTRYS